MSAIKVGKSIPAEFRIIMNGEEYILECRLENLTIEVEDKYEQYYSPFDDYYVYGISTPDYILSNTKLVLDENGRYGTIRKADAES